MKRRAGQISLGDFIRIILLALPILALSWPVLSGFVSFAAASSDVTTTVIIYTVIGALPVMLLARFVVSGERRFEAPEQRNREQRLRQRQPGRRRREPRR